MVFQERLSIWIFFFSVKMRKTALISLKLLKAAVIPPLKRVPLVKDVSREPGETGIGDVRDNGAPIGRTVVFPIVFSLIMDVPQEFQGQMKINKDTINFFKSLYWDYQVSEENIITIIELGECNLKKLPPCPITASFAKQIADVERRIEQSHSRKADLANSAADASVGGANRMAQS